MTAFARYDRILGWLARQSAEEGHVRRSSNPSLNFFRLLSSVTGALIQNVCGCLRGQLHNITSRAGLLNARGRQSGRGTFYKPDYTSYSLLGLRFLFVHEIFGGWILIMSEKQRRLVLAIIEFLNQSIDDGTVKQDDREGLEVASVYPIPFDSQH